VVDVPTDIPPSPKSHPTPYGGEPPVISAPKVTVWPATGLVGALLKVILSVPGRGAWFTTIDFVDVRDLAGFAESWVVRVTWNVPVLE